MRRTLVSSLAAALVLGLAVAALAGGDVAQVLHDQYRAGKPIPLPSKQMKNLDLETAYKVQAAFVNKLKAHGDRVAGYKAGLTSAPAQKKFKAPGPASGVLLASMVEKDGVVEADLFTKMMLEVEIGYRFGKDITAPVTARSVRKYVAAVMPAVEVPDLAFATFKGLTFEDIVAANVGARAVVLGKALDPAKLDVNRVTGRLFYNGKPLGPAVPGKAALGDQWKALAWTVNNVLQHGGEVKKGMVIITGSLGRMYPARPGAYKAVYTGGLGELAFRVK